jgi:tRNA U34 5-carboxymethylaminomethyl modifying GTPase MnmE/TrmE
MKTPIILVGTKCDLEEKKKEDNLDLKFPIFKVSSKTGTNVEEVFMKLSEIPKKNFKNHKNVCKIM